MGFFLARLNYTFGNEDWRTEEEALNLQPSDHVLCITASGDRPLNLLKRPCQRVVCVDANPAQNYLLELKRAAMQVLPHEEYLAFLGITTNKQRINVLQTLIPHMSIEAANFWKNNEKMIRNGIIYQGTVERLTKIVSRVAALIRGKKVKKLFAATDIEEQKKLVEREWNSLFWRKFFEVVLNPFVSRLLIEDPGLENIGQMVNPGVYIYEKMQASLKQDLARNSPLLSLILRGEVLPDAFSPYLQQHGIDLIKNRLAHLEIHSMDVIEYLKSVPSGTFDAFSMSDVASYITYDQFIELLQAIVRAAKPRARFCLRQFLSSHAIPRHLHSSFVRNKALEKKLEQQDSCFVYRFLTGTIVT